ncbi:simple sugar transport system permease protein [Actinomadura hallensis]|uniref:Simple sugar transport system permease protein n=1 Tax=Actinomadura hallensis TaxID=337895 RepID=A0A543ILQ7_9ACTN|nr:ABC transporter permease [Actinomadura hallensis]TQM71516.1 simple sugar transport system permease protein [Actinomadura hallensis]
MSDPREGGRNEDGRNEGAPADGDPRAGAPNAGAPKAGEPKAGEPEAANTAKAPGGADGAAAPTGGLPEPVPAWKAILRGLGPTGLALKIGAPLLALLISLVITMILLRITGADPFSSIRAMVEYGTTENSIVDIVNRATRYYLSAVAVAIGFRMALLNIGVDGQYRLAAFLAAVLGGALTLPAPFGQLLVIVAAMAVGGLWAAIAGVLKVTRGVSEVLSTIMLNAIATGLIAYLLNDQRLAELRPGSNNIATPTIPEEGRVGPLNGFLSSIGIDLPGQVYGLLPLAVVVGIVFWVVINRTRFGFDLRISGLSQSAAQASGVSARRMIVYTMVASGVVAGLIGMPELLGASYEYSLNFPAGLGFTGITIALLGRNHPVGIALAALLFAFLDQTSDVLQSVDVPKEIVGVMQGVVVLTVVIVYELVRRWEIRLQQRTVATELATGHDLARESTGSGS